ncbi:tubulin-specific chaperone E isoform X2 [Ischnura elegans]|nr:tubulin-specific chaperone E isoform X2 [Ischnura elegans]XP_046399866.1 tubulin-specific chaperone E isoform X2 [Ischnura elegans]
MPHKMIASDEKPLHLKKGKRIECNGERGTVLYVGEVPPTSGVWLGIEWDDPSRGKHDGLHEGDRYFQTRHPTSGSFVRPLKVDFGRSFLSALKDRYREIKGDDTYGVDPTKLSQLKRELNVRFIEIVGLDQVNKIQSCLKDLQVAGLRDEKISKGDQKGLISEECPAIQELDLSRNLLSDWITVAEIVAELPCLRVLNLSENLIQVPDDPESISHCFKSLEHMVLGKMEYSWDDVMTCIKMWPNIQELQIPSNNISKLATPPLLHALQSLDLQANPIGDWEEVNKLGILPGLETLNVSEIGVKVIRFPEGHKTSLFPSLKRLIVQENKIEEWVSISELNKLTALQSLRILQNPVVDMFDTRTSRQLVIARIGSLTNLNGVEIQAMERKWSERDYIKQAATIKLRMKIPDKDFIKIHPRYAELVEKHGEPEEGELVLSHTTSLSSTLIDLVICSPQRPGVKISKKLPKTMTVQRLKVLVNKILNFNDPRCLGLKLTNPKHPGMEINLDNDQKSLDYFSADTGDVVVVQQSTER